MYMTTTDYDLDATIAPYAEPAPIKNELTDRYTAVVSEKRLNWTTHYQLKKLLGSGGQGVVYLSERRGADQFTLPVALKIFSPENFRDARAYDEAMARIAQTSVRIAQIQHDNLLDIHNFVDRNRIRMQVMEWIDGYDLSRLLVPNTLSRMQQYLDAQQWQKFNEVIITAGPLQPRLKPGIAVSIMRECLGALAALHREDMVHGDIKPSNIMLKITGTSKIVDTGAAFEMTNPPPTRLCTPTYAPPEVLEGKPYTQLSDLASLGYVLVELLAGTPPFAGLKTYRELLEAKRTLPDRLPTLMPVDVARNALLMNFCKRMIATDPQKRFPSAEAADIRNEGAAGFLRQLVKGDLASEYHNDIRVWLAEMKKIEQLEAEG
jgi:eukaryotic-like serine/threonine-protein kinase